MGISEYSISEIRFVCWLFGINPSSSTILVLATHGFIKKVDRVPGNEIERAINIREKYFKE